MKKFLTIFISVLSVFAASAQDNDPNDKSQILSIADLSMDDYLAMSRGKHETALDAVRESGLPFIESFHAAIAEAARKGALVIVDHVIGESRRWIQDLLNRLDGIPRILVRVECRQDVLLERERRRTDRTPAPAHAQRQHAGIHRHFPHDFSIDTSADTPRKCAMRLISLLPGEFLP